MYPDVISAEYVEEYRIRVAFEDGTSGVVDFEKYLDRGGVFSAWRSLRKFKRFRVNKELGVLVWNDAIDIAPETLYSEATGASLPEWAEPETGRRQTA